MKKTGCILIIVMGLGVSRAWAQGSLTPPGAPSATMRSLGQIESRTPISTPGYTIRNPGSYYLTTNLFCSSFGITIATNDVVLDLNGFAIIGDGTGVNGIGASGYKENLTVYNGTVTRFGNLGMDVSVIRGSRVENMTFSHNVASGMAVGDHSHVLNCKAHHNGSHGIRGNDRSIVKDCMAWENGLDGIVGDLNTIIENCVAFSNQQSGISASDGAIVRGCASAYNASNGIYALAGVLVKDNNCHRNGAHGIRLTSRGCAQGNECAYNGQLTVDGSGIYMSSVNNRIEDNHVASNDIGIWAPGSPNLIAKNTAVANATEYDVSAGNRFAPLDTSGAFTNAWANFDF